MTKVNQVNPNVDPTNWANQLKSAVDAHKPAAQQKGSVSGPKYMTVSGGKYSLTSKRSDKLPLARITAISIDAITKLKENYLAKSDLKPADVRRYSEAASDIAKLTNTLIQARIAKRNQPHKLFFRTLAKVILAVASLVLIGLPFFIMMRNADRKFAVEVDKLRQELQQTANTSIEAGSAHAKKVKEAEIFYNRLMLIAGNFENKQIDKLLQVEEVVPQLLDQLREISDKFFDAPFDSVNRKAEKTAIYTQLKDCLAIIESAEILHLPFESASKLIAIKNVFVNDFLPNTLNGYKYPRIVGSGIQAKFDNDMANYNKINKESKPAVLETFEQDFNRQSTLKRQDDHLKIKDANPVPASGSQQKVKDALQAINEICEHGNPRNKKWGLALQLAATQTSESGAIGDAKGFLSSQMTNSITVIEEGQEYFLTPQEKTQPTQIIVHRAENGDITKIGVKVEGELNIIKQAFRNDENDQKKSFKSPIVVPGAVEYVLYYSISLDENDEPIVGEVYCDYLTSLTSNETLKKALVNQEIADNIDSKVSQFPKILEDLERVVSDDERLKLLQKRMVKDFPQDANAVVVEQFANDMKRGTSFRRKDKALGIEDAFLQPSYELKNEARIQSGAELLAELFKSEEDKNWGNALQLVCNQSSLNNNCDGLMLMFNIEASSFEWKDPETNAPCALKSVFSGRQPPIDLEVIRNKETNAIEKVKVEVKAIIDIAVYDTHEGTVIKPALSEAVKANLTYTVRLDADNHPIISNLQSKFDLKM